MKKTLLFALIACAFLGACSTSDKAGDVASSSDSDKMMTWGDADITNLEDTQLSHRFKKAVSPIVYFNLNESSLSPAALVVIEGHCDERGTREYNLALGERRASAVKDFFKANGIVDERIRTISYGKERPDVFGSTEAAWSKNRRAVTIVN